MLQALKGAFSEKWPKSNKNILTLHDYVQQFCSENIN